MAVYTAFHEVLFDPNLVRSKEGERYPVTGSPQFANTINQNEFTGIAKTNITRFDEWREIVIKIGLVDALDSAYFNNFWLGGWGSGIGFRFRYAPDYVVSLETFAGPTWTQVPNGVLTQFKLYNTYTRPGITSEANSRRIVKPVAPASKETNGFALKEPNGTTTRSITHPFRIHFEVSGVTTERTTGWTVNVKTGVVTFTTPPATGTYIKWSGEYDIPVAFMDNSYIHQFDVPSEIEGVRLREILPAELGIT